MAQLLSKPLIKDTRPLGLGLETGGLLASDLIGLARHLLKLDARYPRNAVALHGRKQLRNPDARRRMTVIRHRRRPGDGLHHAAGRPRGSTIARGDSDPRPRRTQLIRQRRRTDIRTLHLLAGLRLAARGQTERWWRPEATSPCRRRQAPHNVRQPLAQWASGLHPSDEPLRLCQSSLPNLIGRSWEMSTPRLRDRGQIAASLRVACRVCRVIG